MWFPPIPLPTLQTPSTPPSNGLPTPILPPPPTFESHFAAQLPKFWLLPSLVGFGHSKTGLFVSICVGVANFADSEGVVGGGKGWLRSGAGGWGGWPGGVGPTGWALRVDGSDKRLPTTLRASPHPRIPPASRVDFFWLGPVGNRSPGIPGASRGDFWRVGPDYRNRIEIGSKSDQNQIEIGSGIEIGSNGSKSDRNRIGLSKSDRNRIEIGSKSDRGIFFVARTSRAIFAGSKSDRGFFFVAPDLTYDFPSRSSAVSGRVWGHPSAEMGLGVGGSRRGWGGFGGSVIRSWWRGALLNGREWGARTFEMAPMGRVFVFPVFYEFLVDSDLAQTWR